MSISFPVLRWLKVDGPKKIYHNYIYFIAHLWQLDFPVKHVTLTLWWRIIYSICKQKIVVMQNIYFSAINTLLAFCKGEIQLAIVHISFEYAPIISLLL